MSPVFRLIAVLALILLGCSLLGAGTMYYFAQHAIEDAQTPNFRPTLGVSYRGRACWDDQFTYVYCWGSDETIEFEFVGVTQLDAEGLEVTADPNRPKRRLDETRWVWEDGPPGDGWTTEELHKLDVVAATPGEHRYWGRFAVGWPQRAFACEWRQSVAATSGLFWTDMRVSGASVSGGDLVKDRWIRPTRVLWPGAIINAAAFAGMWAAGLATVALIVAASRTGRRILRARRGRCPLCGYQLHDNLADGCPECGWRR